MGLFSVLGLVSPDAEPSPPEEVETPAVQLRERALVMDAHRALAEYLAMRDTSEDVTALDVGLQAVRDYVQTWRSEIAGQGTADNRAKMTLLAERHGLERAALDELLEQVGDMDSLFEALDAEADPERRAALQKALDGVLQALPA